MEMDEDGAQTERSKSSCGELSVNVGPSARVISLDAHRIGVQVAGERTANTDQGRLGFFFPSLSAYQSLRARAAVAATCLSLAATVRQDLGTCGPRLRSLFSAVCMCL